MLGRLSCYVVGDGRRAEGEILRRGLAPVLQPPTMATFLLLPSSCKSFG